MEHWRDCQEWRKQYGLDLSTTNNEAAKLMDAIIYQILSYRDVPSTGGVDHCMSALSEADPNFVLGQVIGRGLAVIGGAIPLTDPKVEETMRSIWDIADRPTVPTWERMHVQALEQWTKGEVWKACDIYEDILLDHPTDIFSLIMSHRGYFGLGEKTRRRDLVGKVLPEWKPSMQHYGFLHGMHSFGLVETNYFDLAEEHAKKALKINPLDCWATHCNAHVHYSTSRRAEGKIFLSDTESDWSQAEGLAHHVYWHHALLELEDGNHSEALAVYDDHIHTQALKTKNLFDIMDSSSLLKRLQFEGVDVGERWRDVSDMARPFLGEHAHAFSDVHVLLSYVGGHQEDLTTRMMESVHEQIRSGLGDHRLALKRFSEPAMRAMIHYEAGEYGDAVDILYPIRREMHSIGGSYAQGDLFQLLLIHSALRSSVPRHHNIARRLIAERQSRCPESPMLERLMTQARAHDH